jgi:hypothetical protein
VTHNKEGAVDFAFWPAALAGVIGGAVMFGTRLVMKKVVGVDLKMDVARMWGTMMGAHGTSGRVLGFVFHLVVSALIAVVYAWAFDALGIRDDLWLWGLVGGAIHWVIAGMFLAMVPSMHPEIPEERPAPGAFAKNFGAPDVPAFLMGHLLYGFVVGVVYAYLHAGGGGNAAF